MAYLAKKIHDSHHSIMRLLLVDHKLTNNEIAAIVGVTPQTVSNTRNSPLVRQQLDVLHATKMNAVINVNEAIKALAPNAVGVLKDVMACGTKDSDKLTAARDVLDRAGHKPDTNVNIRAGILVKSDLDDIKKRAEESGLMAVKKEEIEDAEILASS